MTADAVSFIRPRWSRWLRRLTDAGLGAADLARAFAAERGNDEPGGAYLRLVREWAAGRKTVSSESAYAVGEIAHAEGVEWSSGIRALHAAGYFADTIGVIYEVSQFKCQDVAILICALPAANAHVPLQYAGEMRDAKRASLVCMKTANIVRSDGAWERWCKSGSMHGAPPYLRNAYVLLTSKDIQIRDAEEPAWDLAVSWALDQVSDESRRNLASLPRRLNQISLKELVEGAVAHAKKENT